MSAKPKAKRRKGDGSVFLRGRIWWFAYKHPAGHYVHESSHSDRQSVALRLLRKQLGAAIHNLPVIANAEQLSFHDAAKMLVNRFKEQHASNLTERKVEKELAVLTRRIEKRLAPFFGNRRMLGITTPLISEYIAARMADTIVVKKARPVTLPDGSKEMTPEVRKPVAAATINRELATLKRMFMLSIEAGLLATKPRIRLLRENNARAGFFEREQYESVLRHLPAELQGVVSFAYVTGWRLASEVLPLEWQRVDFNAGEVRLDPGATKNREGRVFPMTDDLRRVLKARWTERERVKKAGHITPFVFFREVADGRGGEKKPQPIVSINKAWKAACRAAGCPGRIPHDLRRTAVRNLVNAGVSEKTAMDLVGHKTRSIFDRYKITSPGDLKHAAALLDVAARNTASRLN